MIRTHALQWGAAGRPLTPPLDLNLAAGTATAVLGANGSGKSTLLNVLASFSRPLAGSVQVQARAPGCIGYLPQHQLLDKQYPMNLGTLVGAGLWRSQATRSEQRRRLHLALEQWDLAGLQDRPLGVLSGGELQRALLARITLQEARLLLLDEPESALDESGQALFWAQVQRWQTEGRTLVVACHDHEAVCRYLDQALWIDPQGCRFGAPCALLPSQPLSRRAA